MLKVRIKIANKNKAAGIDFVHLTHNSIFSFFALTNNATVIQTFPYSSTIRTGNNNDKTAKPVITSFNSPVSAGTGEVLTIVGKYFGAPASKEGTVIFKNANRGHIYPKGNSFRDGIDNFDIVLWHNDTIQIRIPHTIDSITHNVNAPDYYAIPGSGKFKVLNRFGMETESATELTIPYAILQYVGTTPTTKSGINLAGINNDGYIVHLNHNVVAAFPSARAVFKKALKEWSCVTGIKWTLGKDTSLAVNYTDGVCVISLSSIPKFIGLTTHEAYNCPASGKLYLEAFDIEIGNTINWQLDTVATNNIATNKYDLYAVIMHELGHAHLTDHINDSLVELMFWGVNQGPVAAANRKSLKTSPSTRDGGDYVALYRIASTTCAGTHVITIPLHCSGISEVETPIANKGITIYPNPVTSSYVTIDVSGLNTSGMSFTILDFMGKEIKRIESNEISESNYKLNVEGLAKGVYLLQVITGSKQQSFKFIKG